MKWFVLACLVAVAAATTPLTMNVQVPLTNQQLAANQIQCYQMTLSDAVVRQVVFWNTPKLFLQLTPCAGLPHMKVSVYGCPSQTKTVYEYMSQTMINDAIAQGNAASIPPAWEWPGDVETLTIDITHKTYYIEISNIAHNSAPLVPSIYTLYADMFDANTTSSTVPGSQSQLYPLVYMANPPWDRTIVRDNSTDSSNSFSFGGGSTTNIVAIDFNPPGLPGGNVQSVMATPYVYSFYVLEITNAIGTSVAGPFVSVVPAMCPTDGECTTSNCRTCSTNYPNCPKEFLTDCSETTLNIATLQANLNSSTTPFNAYVKDPTQWNAWTPCGAQGTMNRVDANGNYAVLTPAQLAAQPPVYLPQTGGLLVTLPSNQLQLSILGLSDANNNVYLVNIVVHSTLPSGPLTAAHNSNTTESAIYQFMTLQMRTPRYETPQLNSTDYAVIIGVSCGLGACIIIFVGVAILVRHKRKQKLAQRIRMKK